MRSILFGLFILSLVIFFSCHKELSQANNPQAGDVLLAKRIIQLPFHLIIDSFAYDSQNRCTRMYIQWYDSAVAAQHTMYYEFHYNGNDSLPYKMTDSSEYVERLNWWVQYDAKGRKIVDSILNFGLAAQQVSYYTYSRSQVFVNSNVLQTYGELRNLRDTFDYDGDNCIQYRAFNSRVGGGPYWWQYSMTFDDYINPISRLNIAPAFFFGGAGTMGLIGGLNRNNIITWTFTSSDPTLPLDIKTYHYTYDLNGNVTSSSATYSAYPTKFERVSYEYIE